MQRKAVVLPGIAVVLAALVTGCSAGSGADGQQTDNKAGGTAAVAPPGKYRSLPEPCRSVGSKRLKEMLPASPALTTEQVEQLYAGKADPSYDADRRVGCRWKSETSDATRLLYVGYERVVSYDSAVSDDDRAREVYERQLEAAHLPVAAATTPPATGASGAPSSGAASAPTAATTSASGAPASGAPASGAPGSGAAGTPGGSPSSSTGPGAPPLGSRRLDNLADSAFLEDKLGAAGPTAQARTVRIVFRTSNVIVTVEYTVQPTQRGVTPDSEETQVSAQELAAGLAEEFED
ncbi:DUF3558 domain-containing protein [Streptomyces sp. NBC_00239]|uniref:DUF3558 domain-containing protein n=1 Tax=Streptomyces sp. NBC_00239 TaxID=2903640 RepID=UPI002E2ABD7A|nr:DUF3558 domain-containing protein [Streptomyces sp. NBC_00239]